MSRERIFNKYRRKYPDAGPVELGVLYSWSQSLESLVDVVKRIIQSTKDEEMHRSVREAAETIEGRADGSKIK